MEAMVQIPFLEALLLLAAAAAGMALLVEHHAQVAILVVLVVVAAVVVPALRDQVAQELLAKATMVESVTQPVIKVLCLEVVLAAAGPLVGAAMVTT
jgi:hypothetical protein